MSDSFTSLGFAYRRLVELIDQAAGLVHAGKSHTNAGNIGAAAAQFVAELVALPGGKEELNHRADLVETRCGPGSDYQAARDAALGSYPDRPCKTTQGKLTRGVLALKVAEALPGPEVAGRLPGPTFAWEVAEKRKAIGVILEDDRLGLSKAARRAFGAWARECLKIEAEAEEVRADGCRCLRDVHAGRESGQGSATRAALAKPNWGEPLMASMRAAVDSLKDWIAKRLKANRATKTKRSTVNGESRLKIIGALTKHHRYADGGSLNLEPIGNNELARMADVDKSTVSNFFQKEFQGHTKYKSACEHPAELVAALKLLNGEYSPHYLFGGRPPDEKEREDE